MVNSDDGFDLIVMERPMCASKPEESEDTPKTRKWISTKEAARRAEVSQMTIYRWIELFGIGWRVASRFRVDPDALDKVIAGEHPLPPRKA